jgi:hypothetical protein
MPRQTRKRMASSRERRRMNEGKGPTRADRGLVVGVVKPKFTPLVKTDDIERKFARLASITAKRVELERELVFAVKSARKSGATWTEIGRYLGVCESAARHRFGAVKRVRPTTRAGRAALSKTPPAVAAS